MSLAAKKKKKKNTPGGKLRTHQEERERDPNQPHRLGTTAIRALSTHLKKQETSTNSITSRCIKPDEILHRAILRSREKEKPISSAGIKKILTNGFEQDKSHDSISVPCEEQTPQP
jgi:hypothetical protein